MKELQLCTKCKLLLTAKAIAGFTLKRFYRKLWMNSTFQANNDEADLHAVSQPCRKFNVELKVRNQVYVTYTQANGFLYQDLPDQGNTGNGK